MGITQTKLAEIPVLSNARLYYESKQEVIMAMKLHSLEELEDRYIGPVGTPKRDEYEQKLADELRAYRVGGCFNTER